MSRRLIPLSEDVAAALELGRRALFALQEPGFDVVAYLPVLEQRLRSGAAAGILWKQDERPVGFAMWETHGPLGLTVRLCFLVDGVASAPAYGAFLGQLETEGRRVLFLPAGLAGLTREAEGALLERLGFARYARSEWGFPAEAPLPPVESPAGVALRPFRPGDEEGVARVHAAAYRDRFDRYLFLQDLDPERDAALGVRDLVGGRWGEFLGRASTVAEANGQPVAATLVVRTEGAPLVADVATHPSFARRGVGRATLAETLRTVRAGGDRSVRLVVTEGNARAMRLYARLGFVRHLGPFEEWYRTDLIPFRPSAP